MAGNNFKEKKVISLIFMQFWSRSHFNKLDWLTPQAICYKLVYIQLLPAKTPRETSFVPLLLLRKPHHYNTRHDCTKNLHHHLTKTNTVLLRLKLTLFFSKAIRFIFLNMKPLYNECPRNSRRFWPFEVLLIHGMFSGFLI